jgi:uronate dehydrogenase
MKTVLITGASGGVASWLRTSLRGKYRLRLSDLAPIADLAADETSVPADLSDLDAVSAAVEGVDAIVHLGAVSVEDEWAPILAANFVGTYNLYEAALRAGVKRVVFASSNHAVGFYPRSQTIGVDVTVRPDSRYGVSKAYGEALAALYADKYGVSSLCVRIGNVAERPLDVRRLSIWLHPDDLAQIVEIGLEHPDIRFEIVYGMSDNARAWWDNSNALRLGYRPAARSEAYAEQVLAECPAPTDSPIDQFQGGNFVAAEKGGDPTKEPS